MNKKSRKEYLEKMTDVEYFSFCIKIVEFEFCRRIISERMEHDSDNKFMLELFFGILIGKFFSPLSQSLISFNRMLKAEKDKRWEYISEYGWGMYCTFKKNKSIDDHRRFFKKYFLEEFETIGLLKDKEKK